MKNQTTYEDFEPFCKWRRGKQEDVLEVHLPDIGFRVEHLRATINFFGVLKIVGQLPLGENRWTQFRKEIRIPNNCKRDEIHAKISCGVIYVTMPKRIPSGLQIARKTALKLGLLAIVAAVGAYVAYKYRQAA